jgi:hypothetical protein
LGKKSGKFDVDNEWIDEWMDTWIPVYSPNVVAGGIIPVIENY